MYYTLLLSVKLLYTKKKITYFRKLQVHLFDACFTRFAFAT